MLEKTDAIVALSAGFAPNGLDMGNATKQRLDKAIQLQKDELAPNLVVSGGHWFLTRNRSPVPLGILMRQHAIDSGIPAERVQAEVKSLDTIGNALFTKTEIVEPRGWDELTLVTDESHIVRSEQIFRHVFGPDYLIQGVAAGEHPSRLPLLYEGLGSLVFRAILKGTQPGDTEAIQERLFRLIPGYAENSPATRLHSLFQKN